MRPLALEADKQMAAPELDGLQHAQGRERLAHQECEWKRGGRKIGRPGTGHHVGLDKGGLLMEGAERRGKPPTPLGCQYLRS